VEFSGGRLAMLLIDHPEPPDAAFSPVARALLAARPHLRSATPRDVVSRVAAAESRCRVVAACWERDDVLLAASGAPLPRLFRGGSPLAVAAEDRAAIHTARAATVPGDLLLLASSGLSALQLPGESPGEEELAANFARACEGQSLPAAFARMVSEWKKAGGAPEGRDLLMLAARRELPPH
ncbi:MAG: hypothetical protein ABR576_11545, partial [Thermoanaerobaculia bacterium]